MANKIVLLVHHRICQTTLTRQLSKKGFEVCSLQLPEVNEQNETLMEGAIAFLKEHVDAVGVIVESNYGHPAFEGINRDLLDYIDKNYAEKVKKIAYSGTEASLLEALKQFPKMYAVLNSPDESHFNHERMINHKELIKFLKSKKRSRSMVIPSRTQSVPSMTPSSSSCDKELSIKKCFSVSPRDLYAPNFNEEKEKGKEKEKEEEKESDPLVDEETKKLEKICLEDHLFPDF